jgi:hypothetical protein
VNVVSGGVATLTFSGTDFRNVRMDDNSGNYPAPHWDASRLASGGENSPVCYARSGTFTISAGFTLTAAGTTTGIVRGTLSSGGTVSGAVTLGASSFSVTGLQNSQTVSNSVNYFNPLTITWALSLDGGATFLPMGTTTNEVFVTRGTPDTTKLFRTILYLACSNTGGTDTPSCLANTWAAFNGPANVRGWDAAAQSYTRPLHYYFGGFAGIATRVEGLLATGDGNCNAWAELLHYSLLVNNVASARTTVSSGIEFGVKNLSFSEPPTLGFGVYRYARAQIDATVAGIPGQNTATPAEKLFGVHWIVHPTDPSVSGVYYDPSYGVTAAGATPAAAAAAYTSNAVDGWRTDFGGVEAWAKAADDPARVLTFTDGGWPP